ncbi:MAG: 4-hydroxythreonine-4-phosphate dehydrogenase PdxA [Gemmatimonadetes bacterium]|nr:4-hydroxythreonine-4-phosphate dehydrogenase PdxA [Gemmatimonadota bacterium]MYH54323.1 4-hydroxythreonine-4-phosphate dehydrogenase PdxA [Gemmatimonadota bacterium]
MLGMGGDAGSRGAETAFGGEAGDEVCGDLVRVIGPVECGGDFPDRCSFEAVGGGTAGLKPGEAAGLAIERAVDLALAGEADAVVTAPVHKPALAAAGYRPGHTEMLMALAGVARVGMVMCDEGVGGRPARRVLLATIHVPLARVPELVTPELLVSQTRLLGRALRADWGIEAPRIALCALNPHASDEGMFGTEERDVYAPALVALSGAPWSVTGPVPADTVFRRAFSGEFDAVVAPYHDVGMAAFKTAAFGRGVNVTIGLPFVRTSPDHGTAFDIAGKGVADPSSMIAAMRLAAGLAVRRRGCPDQPRP